LIKFRIDVDYPYPSRIRSFIFTMTRIRIKKDYLKNPKIIAQMINQSAKSVKATWFFTPTTIPDDELLGLLDNNRNEIALHVVNSPYSEWKDLEKATGKRVNYYTIHGTERLLARIIWRRGKKRTADIPLEYPLVSFHHFRTTHLDVICYSNSPKQALRVAEEATTKGYVLHFHPIWLFQRGRINHRGPIYGVLRSLLDVDSELRTIEYHKKNIVIIARDSEEYTKNVSPSGRVLQKLKEMGADIFTFVERKWCYTYQNPNFWTEESDNVGLLHVTDYNEWWNKVGKKIRNMVRKAYKSGIRTYVVEPSKELAQGIWKIYNETPTRQDRAFPHYGVSLQKVSEGVLSAGNSTYIAAFLEDEIVGFVQLVHGDNVTIISQILSLQKYWDKAVNNALVGKVVEVCANMQAKWIMYGRIGNHPSLDRFKESNGFKRFPLTRYYIPLTRKGRLAAKLGFHKEIKDTLPQPIKYRLIPLYNWISRTKMRVRLILKHEVPS
jgi:hypothetical protein